MLDILQKELTPTDELSPPLGLSTHEATRRLKINGLNKLKQKKKTSVMKIFANQFKDFMVMILLIATLISALLGEMYDAITIIAIVILNATLGFVQEFRTEHTLEALAKMTSPHAKVYRDGKLVTISADEMVDGDVYELSEGDRVPCDGFILSCKGFFCDESILTGEAEPVAKESRRGQTEYENLNLSYMTYMGTICTKGNARCVCTHTGLRTQMGKISDMLEEIPDELTPLQKKLGELGKILGLICIGVCFLVFVVGILRGEPAFDMLMTGITIAIAAIPEGLPATVTIALALAVRRMLKQNALVNKLHSVETLGCATVICSDKTGTITENKMTVQRIFSSQKTFTLTGTGYEKNGRLLYNSIPADLSQHPALEELLNSFEICNNAKIYDAVGSSRNRRQKSIFQVTGDPTESALLVASAKLRKEIGSLHFERLDEIPFDSATRQMTVTARLSDGRTISCTKGAVDVILNKCGYVLTDTGIKKIDKSFKSEILNTNDAFATDGLRVLAFCQTLDGKTVFLGLCGMSDPLRPEVKKAIKACDKAKIKTVMITGDHKLTAIAIAREAGIFKANSLAVTGDELSKMTDAELEQKLNSISVFARISPDHKLRIVKAFKRKGHIVAMTGDGVNDAPAIKEADIGVSMGISGTDVSKQASDVILLDDNFSTLTTAIEQGRVIYSNIRKFVRYLISCNIGEVLTMLLSMLMGLPVVLLPTQILLVNLATDGLPAIALGLEPPDKSLMQKPPRKNTDSFFSNGLMSRIVFRGALIGLFTIASFVIGLRLGGLCTARTMALFTLVASQLIHVFECKSEEKNLLSVDITNNLWLVLSVLVSALCLVGAIYIPFLQNVFSTVSLGISQLLTALGLAVAVPVLACFIPKK